MEISETPEKLKARFAYVDGIEVFNANQNKAENEYGKKVWEALGIVGIGGSDAHSVRTVGRYLTRFQNVIRNEEDLVAEIKDGRCKPVAYDAQAQFRPSQLTVVRSFHRITPILLRATSFSRKTLSAISSSRK